MPTVIGVVPAPSLEGVMQGRAELDLDEVERDLVNLLLAMDRVSGMSEGYQVDELKVSVGLTMDEGGTLKAGIWASFATFFKGGVEAEATERTQSSQLIEITIKRK